MGLLAMIVNSYTSLSGSYKGSLCGSSTAPAACGRSPNRTVVDKMDTRRRGFSFIVLNVGPGAYTENKILPGTTPSDDNATSPWTHQKPAMRREKKNILQVRGRDGIY